MCGKLKKGLFLYIYIKSAFSKLAEEVQAHCAVFVLLQEHRALVQVSHSFQIYHFSLEVGTLELKSVNVF